MRGSELLFVAVLGTAYAGFALLALSQRRNWTTFAGSTPLPNRHIGTLRIGGSVLLASSLVAAVVRDGPAFGAILWVVILTVAGALVVFTLTWRAQQAGR